MRKKKQYFKTVLCKSDSEVTLLNTKATYLQKVPKQWHRCRENYFMQNLTLNGPNFYGNFLIRPAFVGSQLKYSF